MKSICIFAGSSLGAKESYRNIAFKLGQELVKNNFSMVYGGGSVGLMGKIADSVLESGGKVTGVITNRLKEAEVGQIICLNLLSWTVCMRGKPKWQNYQMLLFLYLEE